ncbi:putative epoxide hydrolase [Pseudocercospora fuligena]|uniref:Putative epoxide hydrolase n=1 Tax=Pseudocercospora fuligena TaxID=685502 RepID=A0A8H6VMX0_9PEZI|nr:putative epoxide hydrolase [Pseudocercospora fuligena]
MSNESAIKPFMLAIADAQLEDLRNRLGIVRWPPRETVKAQDGSASHLQVIPLQATKEMHKYWSSKYDWRKCESWFNKHPQFTYTSTIDNKSDRVYFMHIRSKHNNATPMLMVHGWPGSVLEFHKVIGPLADPTRYGGEEDDAFHLVIPALPGYAWSSQPDYIGCNFSHISKVFVNLMAELGYDKQGWVAQGGDWGADIIAEMASSDPPESLLAVHMNTAFFNAAHEIETSKAKSEGVTPEEIAALKKSTHFENNGYGYFLQQATRPQTLSYSLSDSPIGLASWIYEKLWAWTQHAGNSGNPVGFHDLLSYDEILDNIMLYWLSNSGASSVRLYWEAKTDNTALPIKIPVGVSIFPGDLVTAPKKWGERYYDNIVHWREVERGGHFAAWEVPELFVREVRETFRKAMLLRERRWNCQ